MATDARAQDSPFIVGIDLGTTNCAVAYVERRTGDDPLVPEVRVFDIPQLTAAGSVELRPVLPSFLYLMDEREGESAGLRLPWGLAGDPVGVFARDEGALVPTRQVASAKSWLAYGGVDRTAAILPFGRDAGARGVSPVDASTRYLAHIRDAWNFAHARGASAAPLEAQQVVLTVPASFDEEARELTIAAAAAAGLVNLTVIEEPLAALYAWIARHRRMLTDHLGDADTVLVCDVGGGTTDFSLIRVSLEGEELAFERVAIGEHLLLGGDNLDLALAAAVEERLGTRLTLTQRLALRRQCTAAKERILNDAALHRVPVTILGSGRAVIGGTQQADVRRGDVERLLHDGFLPITKADEWPRRDRRPGALRELGLPYESDPAVTRHLARFLALPADGGEPASAGDLPQVRPDAVLFNGGFFTPEVARARVVETLARWASDVPRVLPVERPDAAVALGAAYYGHLRRLPDAMRRVLIRAGSPRTYYLGLHASGDTESGTPGTGVPAVSVLPRGVQEGTSIDLPGRIFAVKTNLAVSFPLYSSLIRTDPAGEAIRLDAHADDLHRHAPLVSVLRFGKRSRHAEIPVHLSVRFTELGTLELWLQSRDTEHRWRLQFQLRGEGPPAPGAEEEAQRGDEAIVPEGSLARGEQLLDAVFGAHPSSGDATPETLVAELESTLGYGKQAWPLAVLRQLADRLIAGADSRRRSPRVEARWLNLTGFCLRPGFGASADEWRVGELRKVYAAGLAFPKDVQCQVEWLVLWQRVAGGFSAGQQRELAQRTMAPLSLGGRKGARLNPQVERESWRLLASLERLDRETRVRIGRELATRVRKEPRNTALLWSLGRIGARRPFYGPLDRSVAPDVAAGWIEVLLALPALVPEAMGALVQMAARTQDPALDVDDALRERVLTALERAGAGAELVEPVRDAAVRPEADAVRYFGETLPAGLKLTE